MKIDSVKENVNFRRAYHQGKCYATPIMSVYVRKNRLGTKRLGITVSKKSGSSPVRNRLRRIIRAAAYECHTLLPEGCDIVIVARTALCGKKSTDVKACLESIFGSRQVD